MLSRPSAITTRPMPRRPGRNASTAAVAANSAIGISTYVWASPALLESAVGGEAAGSPE